MTNDNLMLADLPLDELLGAQPLDPARRQALTAELDPLRERFAQALSSGGTREEFARWQASLTALEAALEILGDMPETGMAYYSKKQS